MVRVSSADSRRLVNRLKVCALVLSFAFSLWPGTGGASDGAVPGTRKADVPGRERETERRLEDPASAARAPGFVSLDFREYAAHVLNTNPSIKIQDREYKKSLIYALRNLEAYDFSLTLTASPYGGYYSTAGNGSIDDARPEGGARATLELAKNLYDGGKKRLLEKEYEVVQALAEANLLAEKDAAILAAANYYAELYYRQEVLGFLKEQYQQQKAFNEEVRRKHDSGIKFSVADLLASQSELLKLEKRLLQSKAGLVGSETAFRRFGHIYTDKTVRLRPLDLDFALEVGTLQNYAAVHNNAINAARLSEEVQASRIAQKKAEGGLRIDLVSSLGISEVVGKDRETSTNPIANVALNFSLPLYDGGVRKSELLAEQLEAQKKRLQLQKASEEVMQKITEVWADYRALEGELEILKELVEVNYSRLRIAMARLEKGVDDYRSVRESWVDLIAARIDLIRQTTISQKLLVDLFVLSGTGILDR